MNSTPLVSIICNTYNHVSFIQDTIEGFLFQKTTFPIEILIYDDASPDGTADIVKEYEDRYPDLIRAIYQNENQYSKGISPNRKYQFPRARGKYFAICEGDDYWTDPLKLQKQVDFLEANVDYVITYHDVIVYDKEGNMIKPSKTPDVYKKDYTSLELMKSQIFICAMSMVFRRIDMDDLFDLGGALNWDVVLTSYLGQFGHGKYFPDISGFYRAHEGGIWSGLSVLEKRQNQKKTFEVLARNFRNRGNIEIANHYNDLANRMNQKISDLNPKPAPKRNLLASLFKTKGKS